MAYERNNKPYPPVIRGVSSIWSDEAPPGVLYRARIEPYGDEDTGAGVAYGATVTDSEANARLLTTNIMKPHDGETTIPLQADKGFSNAPNSTIGTQYASDGYLDYNVIPHYPMWFGKNVWLGLWRRTMYNESVVQSDVATKEFYYPHLDEPLYTIDSNQTPQYYRPTTERVLTRIWTQSATLNSGAPYSNSDSFRQGDVFIYFNATDNLFHKVCFVISFYDHAASRSTTGGLTPTNVPYNSNNVPIYFSLEPASAYLYNPELVGALFTDEEEPNLAPLLDSYSIIPYNYTNDGRQYAGLIGNITVTNTFDGLRFRLHNPTVLATYKMYLHIFIDGHYANPESVLLGRGYDTSAPEICNSFVVDYNVKKLSSMLPSGTTETAVKLDCSIGSSPFTWTATPSTKYTKGCPSEETSDC